MSGFDAKKHFILSSPPFTVGRDLSPKGSLDTPIIECVEFLNDLADYVTTSSCSGRVSAYRDVGTKGVDWLMVVHGTITVADIHEALASISLEDESLVVLKCEAFILHVLCRDLEAASKLHQVPLQVLCISSSLNNNRVSRLEWNVDIGNLGYQYRSR
jgi:tRNA wybutosine-synthesizing protein 3